MANIHKNGMNAKFLMSIFDFVYFFILSCLFSSYLHPHHASFSLTFDGLLMTYACNDIRIISNSYLHLGKTLFKKGGNICECYKIALISNLSQDFEKPLRDLITPEFQFDYEARSYDV